MSEHLWMKQAECLGFVDTMWDDNTPSPDALRFCFRCPVQAECADYGLSRPNASDAGVLGGLGLYDRERVRNGDVTVEEAWAHRRAILVQHDFELARAEEFAQLMPRLELA